MTGARTLAVLVLALAGCATAETPGAVETVEGRLQRLADEAARRVPGIALAVVSSDGRWTVTAGVSDPRSRTPLRPDDALRFASVTKTFVATVVLQLAAEGRLRLEDRAADHLAPEVVQALPGLRAATVRQLLQHTSGLADFHKDREKQGALRERPGHPWTAAELLACAARLEPPGRPGERFYYSNTNYVALGLLVERVTGKPLAAVLRERIHGPLGLERTFLETREPGTLVHAVEGRDDPTDPLVNDGLGCGDAGLAGSAGDLARFGHALFVQGRLLAGASRAAMLEGVPDDGDAYGLGVMIARHAGHAIVGHDGRSLGFTSRLVSCPERGVTVAVLVNDGEAGGLPYKVALRALDAVGPVTNRTPP